MATTLQVEAVPGGTVLAVPSLRANFSWMLAGNIVYSACQWGMISVLAKLGSPEVVGRFALGLAITAPVFMFTNLQLRGVQATDARSEFAFADYFSLRLAASLTGLSAICLIALAGGYDRLTAAVILLVGLSKAIETMSDVVAGLLQKFERLDRVAISLMIRGCLSLSAFGTAFFLSKDLFFAVAAMVGVWLAVFLFYDLAQARGVLDGRKGFFSGRWPRLKALALTSAPLGVVMTLISLNVNIPRYLLERSLGAAELGIFASLAYLLVAVNLIVNALGQAAASRLARMFVEGRMDRFRAVVLRLTGFGLLVLALGTPAAKVLGRPLLTLLYRPEYGRHDGLFTIMVATAGISSIASFLGYGMTAARAFRRQVPVIAASTLATVVSSLFMIPLLGTAGAAWSLLIGACVQAAGSGVVLSWAMRGAEG